MTSAVHESARSSKNRTRSLINELSSKTTELDLAKRELEEARRRTHVELHLPDLHRAGPQRDGHGTRLRTCHLLELRGFLDARVSESEPTRIPLSDVQLALNTSPIVLIFFSFYYYRYFFSFLIIGFPPFLA